MRTEGALLELAGAVAAGASIEDADRAFLAGLVRREAEEAAREANTPRARERRRNHWIRAWRSDLLADRTTHAAAVEICAAARRYGGWARDRDLAEPPAAYAGTWRAYLWHALKTGAPFPTGERQIITILAG